MSLTEYYQESYPPYLLDGRHWASDQDAFTDARVTASDALNASRLISYGFRPEPKTDWPTGTGIFINASMRFNWNGSAWLPGIAGLVEEPEQEPEQPPATEPEPEPESVPDEPSVSEPDQEPPPDA